MPKDRAAPPYPGSGANASDILALAQSYRVSAHTLLADRPDGPVAAAPTHLHALHAIELALNAWRRHRGETPEAVRGRRHEKFCAEVSADLGLRRRTATHPSALAADREYLLARYAPGSSLRGSPRDRIVATMEEVLSKVARRIGPACAITDAQPGCRGAPMRDLTPTWRSVPLRAPVPEPRSPR